MSHSNNCVDQPNAISPEESGAARSSEQPESATGHRIISPSPQPSVAENVAGVPSPGRNETSDLKPPTLLQVGIAAIVRSTPEAEAEAVQGTGVYASTSLNSLHSHVPTLPETALYGLPGHVVRECDPYTEAPAPAVLLQLLCMFGNAAGPTPRLAIGNGLHPARINATIVGATAKARKGTSYSVVKQLMLQADPDYVSNCILAGAASGEGIVAALARANSEPRLLLVEQELSSVLARMSRDGNTLSHVIREAYDQDEFRVTTKKDPLRVSGKHVAVIGHITAQELERRLAETDIYNGFANRFLWVLVHRSKLLARGSSIPEEVRNALAAQIQQALTTAKGTGSMTFDRPAGLLWETIYEELSAEEGGVVGSLTCRGEVNTARLSLIYALLDQSSLIRPEHLRAAYVLWKYCVECVRQLFGEHANDPLGARILNLLDGGELSRTALSKALGGHYTKRQLDDALARLKSGNEIETSDEGTEGRRRTCIRAKKAG